MKQILVLGAGLSAPYMISYLLQEAEKHDWFVTVGDINPQLAKKYVAGHSRGDGVMFDVNDAVMRRTHVEKADVVINFLPPKFQYLLALSCTTYGCHMITASYQDDRLADVEPDAIRKGVLILNEMGLDPGIDHMSAMTVIEKVRKNNGRIVSFKSYGSGLPAPESATNPLRYVITWNARNVVMAGEYGSQYMYKNNIKILPYHEVFQRTWTVPLNGVGTMEAYPNRDSLKYIDLYGLSEVETMIRGTLRYPGWSETWLQIVRLGLSNETMHIPNLQQKTYRDLVEMFLPLHHPGADLEHRVANLLHISPTGKIMENLRWLGLFSEETISAPGSTAADVLIDLLKKKLFLQADGRDMVAIVHEIEAVYPEKNNLREKTTSTFIEYGEPGGYTAIAKTVGLPAAIAAKLVLLGEIPLNGCHIPTHPVVYSKILPELQRQGFKFIEETTVVK